MERSRSGREDVPIWNAQAPSQSRCGKEPMQYNPANPLIVQGDRTILLEVDNPLYAEARDAIAPFAELEKSPEHIHTYRLTPLSLWNAAAAGMPADTMIDGTRALLEVSAPFQRAGRPARAGQPLRQSPAGSDRWAASADHPGPAPARRAGTAARRARLSGRAGRRDQLRDRRRQPRGLEAGADLGRLPGRRPGGLHRRCRAAARGSPDDPCRPAVSRPRLSGGGRRGVLRRGRRSRRFGRDRLALRCRQDDRRTGGDGGPQDRDLDPHHQHDGRRAVEAGDPRQDRPRCRARSAPIPAIPRRWRR